MIYNEIDNITSTGSSFVDGQRAAFARVGDIFSAEGVKGDGIRMTAAFELANSAPEMAVADIVEFVVQHVAAAMPLSGAADSYSARRVAAAEAEQRWTAERQDQARELNQAARNHEAPS